METLGGLGSLLVMLTRISLEGSTVGGLVLHDTRRASCMVHYGTFSFPSLYFFDPIFLYISCCIVIHPADLCLLCLKYMYILFSCTPTLLLSKYAFGTTLREAFDRNNV